MPDGRLIDRPLREQMQGWLAGRPRGQPRGEQAPTANMQEAIPDILWFNPVDNQFYDNQGNIVPFETAQQLMGQYQSGELLPEVSGITPQPPDGDGRGEVVVPGELIVMSDGTYTDYLGQPVDWATAQTMLRQYNAQFLPGDDQAITPFQQAQISRWGEQDVLAREQLALQERQWQAGLQARPEDFIQRWFAEQKPQRRPGRGQAGRELWAGASPLEKRALMELGGPWQITRGEGEAFEEGTFPFRPGTESAKEFEGRKPAVKRLPITEIVWGGLSEEEREEAISGVKGKIRKKRERGPQAPPAPAWLPQFAPGQRVGEEITAGPIKTPSAQLWSRTPWSVRGGLSSFAEFAGGRPLRDIMDEMAMMQPIRPEQRVRWQPQRRRV